MGRDLNLRQLRAIDEFIKHGIKSRAYALAGYQTTNRESQDAAASRLFRSVKVKAEINRRKRAMIKRSDVTMDKLLSDADEARALAMASGQPSAAIAATQLTAKLVGLLVDRKEQGQPGDFAGLTTADEIIAQTRLELGEEAARALAAMTGRTLPPPAEPPEQAATPTVQGPDSIN